MYKIQMDVLLNFIKRQMVFIVVIALIGGAALTFLTSAKKDLAPIYSSTSVIYVSDYRVESSQKRFNYSVSEGSIYSACRSYIEEPSFAQKVARDLGVDTKKITVATPRVKNELNESVSTPLILLQVTAPDKETALKGSEIATQKAVDTFKDLMHLNQVEVITQPTLNDDAAPVATTGGFSVKKFIGWTAVLFILIAGISLAQTIFSRKIRVASDLRTKLGIEPSGYVRSKDCSQESSRERLLAAQLKALIREDNSERPAVATLTDADMSQEQFSLLQKELTDRLTGLPQKNLITLHGADNKLDALEKLEQSDAIYVVVVANKASSAKVRAAHESLSVLGKTPTRMFFCE